MWVIKSYIIAALILSALSMIFSMPRGRLLKLKWYSLLIFFALLPLIAIREVVYVLAGMLKDRNKRAD